jgi:uncharacterized protein involved in exopolysaccharide biosynthesis
MRLTMDEERIDLLEDHHHHPSLTLTLRDKVAVLFRHKRLCLISFVVILAAVLQGALTPTYKAEMKILVRRERVDPVVTSQQSAPTQVVQEEITDSELNSEVQLLKSQDLLRKVVIANNLQSEGQSWRHALFRKWSPEVRMARGLRGMAQSLKAELVPRTNMISVSFESSDPDMAARVLKSLAGLYLEKHLQVHRASGEFGFFDQEAERLRQGLGRAETRLTDFTHEQGVVSAQLERDLTLQKASELEASLTQTQAAIAEIEQRIRTLEQQAASTQPRLTTQLRTSDNPALLQQMKSSLLQLELKKTEMLSKFEPSYRPVVELEKQISETRAAIAGEKNAPVRDETTDQNPVYEWVKSELAKAQTDLSGQKARAAAVQAALARYRGGARALQQAAIVQQDLQRTAKTEEENYLLYRRKQEEARINDALDRGGILNVAIAEPPTVPALPARSALYYGLLGMFLATAGSIGLAFASDRLDPSFRTPDEVLGFLGSPVLASIPKNGRWCNVA